MRLFSEWYSNYNVSTFPARLRRAHHAPCLFLPRVSHARAPAVSKTRTQFVPFPGLARPRLVPGARPRTASVGRGPQKAFLHRSYDTAAVPGKSRGCAGHITHPVCVFSQPRTPAHLRRASRAPCLCLCPASHARGWFRVRACTRLLLAGARACGGQIARASVYLRLLYQKGRVKSKRMDEFYRTFIRSLSRLCCGGRKRGASARAKRRDKRRTGAVRNSAAQGITASGGEILTRTKPNRERMNNR